MMRSMTSKADPGEHDPRRRAAALAGLSLAAGLACASVGPARANTASRRLDFTQSLREQDWEWQGSGRWQLGPQMLRLTGAGTVRGPIRMPSALALLREPAFGAVTISAQLRSSASPRVAERDLLFVFGHQSPTRFYYAHLSAKADAIHSGIFLVADADRRRLDTAPAQGVFADEGWTGFRLVRDPASGSIDVFRADQKTPVLRAQDRTLATGRVGFGSFDDTGEFREIVIEGQPSRSVN